MAVPQGNEIHTMDKCPLSEMERQSLAAQLPSEGCLCEHQRLFLLSVSVVLMFPFPFAGSESPPPPEALLFV